MSAEQEHYAVKRYYAAEHEMHKAVAFLDTLGVLIQAKFTALDAVDLEALNMLAVQYDAAMEHVRPVVQKLYGPLRENEVQP